MKVIALVCVSVLFSTLFLACSSGAGGSGASEVPVTLSEFKIDTSLTSFEAGKQYRFVIKNGGALAHEWMIMPRGETDHMKALAAADQKDLGPGATKAVEYTFKEKGNFEFACHIPSHYEGGMRQDITVG